MKHFLALTLAAGLCVLAGAAVPRQQPTRVYEGKQEALIVSPDGVNQVMVWWHTPQHYRMEWSPDAFAWFTLSERTTGGPFSDQPLVYEFIGNGNFWSQQYFRLLSLS